MFSRISSSNSSLLNLVHTIKFFRNRFRHEGAEILPNLRHSFILHSIKSLLSQILLFFGGIEALILSLPEEENNLCVRLVAANECNSLDSFVPYCTII